MSHSTCMVVLPREPKDRADLDRLLSDVLSPFDEGLDVEPYRDYVEAAPAGWEEGVANGQRFEALMASGLAREVAWKTVWGEENTDPHLAWPRSAVVGDGVDPTDDVAVASHYNAKYPEEGSTRYEVDEQGLYSWSTYNPQSRWDWWVLGGRWTGYFQVRADATSYLGRPGSGDNSPPQAVGTIPADACRKGDVDIDGMVLARGAEAAGWFDDAHRRYPDDPRTRQFMADVREGESREDYIVRKANPEDLLRPFAVLAEGCWKDAGRMRMFGVDDSTEDSRESYAEWFARFWPAMPPDTWLAVVDVHI